jgi:hypothetical protein
MLCLGKTVNDNEPVELTMDERKQGTYIIGTTGTGKSTLLKNIIYQDMREDLNEGRPHGVCVLDPHGDLIDELLGLVPKDRIKDVILFNPMDTDRPFGLNLLACNRDDPHEIRWVVSTIMGTLRRLYSYSWGPLLEHVLRNSILTAMTLKEATFLELVLLLTSEEYRKKVIRQLEDPVLKQFWAHFPKSERLSYELTSSTINKISPFITDKTMRNIVGQPNNTVNLRKVMDEGKIFFINLSKGDIGEENSSLLGSVIVNLVLIAALQRRSDLPEKRRQFHLVVDEFQNFATESFSILQSEARKYGVDVVVAHQYRDQLDDISKGSTLNVGNLVVFRVSGQDGFDLASQFDNTPPPPEIVMEPRYQLHRRENNGEGVFKVEKPPTGAGTLYHEVPRIRRTYSDMQGEMANRLSIQPNYQAWCRLIHDPRSRGVQAAPRLEEFNISTEVRGEEITKEKKKEISDRIRAQSSEMGTPCEKVEAEIRQRSYGEIDSDRPLTSEELH